MFDGGASTTTKHQVVDASLSPFMIIDQQGWGQQNLRIRITYSW